MMAARLPAQPIPLGEPKKSSIPRMRGGSVAIIYSESSFRDRYLDEYTGEILPAHLIRDAIINELDYFNDKVWKMSSREEMEKIPDYILIRSR